MKKHSSFKLYLFAFIITGIIFGASIYFSDYINKKRTQELQAIEEKISLDILAFETQFDLLKEASCDAFGKFTLREELDSLNSKLIFLEQQLGVDNPEVFKLKRYYSILEIKDYILNKRMDEQCKTKSIFILYFYSYKDCSECTIQEYILRAIKDKYPEIDIYTFDYNLDLPVISTLLTLHNVPEKPPIIDINGKLYAPFDSLTDIEAVLEPYLKIASSTLKALNATSTQNKSGTSTSNKAR